MKSEKGTELQLLNAKQFLRTCFSKYQIFINTEISQFSLNLPVYYFITEDRVDKEILNLTTRFFSLETHMTMFDTSADNWNSFSQM